MWQSVHEFDLGEATMAMKSVSECPAQCMYPTQGPRPPGLDHPPQGHHHTLAGSRHASGKLYGGSHEYDPPLGDPALTSISINPGGIKPNVGD